MNTSGTNELSVVLPANNEVEALPVLLSRVISALNSLGITFELLVVDDGSTDGTWAAIADLARQDSRIRGIRLSRNFGHQSALLAGLRASRGSAVITMDADGEHPPDVLPLFIQRWRAGALVVQGVRRDAGEKSWTKRLSSEAFYRLISFVGNTQVVPGSADFRLLDRRAVDEVVQASGQSVFLRGLVPWLGFPTDFVEFKAGHRIAGRPSYSFAKMLSLSLSALLSMSSVPLRLVAIVGLASACASFLFLIYVVAVRFLNGQVVPGWASVAGIVTLLGGLQLLALGTVGEYVGRLFASSIGRPPYVVLERTSQLAPSVQPRGDSES
jgi:dolichol-phosphate mannosyltransferase